MRTVAEAIKEHFEKSSYRVPTYILTNRSNISTMMCQGEFQVNQLLCRGHKSEIFSAKIRYYLPVVIKKATKEAFAEKDIVNEIQLLTKMDHRNIIDIKGARVSGSEPFMGMYLLVV